MSALLGLLAACATYVPQPLEPDRREAEFRSRSLADPGLRAWLEAHPSAGRPPAAGGAWDLDALTRVAFYYHPDLDVARARAAVAAAAVRTAGARPNPTLGVRPEYAVNAPAGTPPWVLGFPLDIPVETAGRRGYRIAQAERLTDAARAELAETAWKVRSRVRAALVSHLLAQREAELRRAEADARASAAALVERRRVAGEAAPRDVLEARLELATAKVELRSAEARELDTRAALAAAVGLPDVVRGDPVFALPDLDAPPAADAFEAHGIQSRALHNRADLQGLLAGYAAAEAALQLEVAKQYPDVTLGPGYTYDQGQSKFALGLSASLPLFNRNEGPIAEAEARRREAGERFLALQAQIIGDAGRAVERYRAEREGYAPAQEQSALAEMRERVAQRAVEAGEDDRLALAAAQAGAAAAARRSRLDALRRVQEALGALEDVVQAPLSPPDALPELPRSSPRDASHKENER